MSPRLVPSLLFVSIAFALTAFGRDVPVPNDILQFTSGGHIVGFAADAVYVASNSHALRVQFINARATRPASAAAPSGAQRAAALSQVSYPNLWDGITLTYDAPDGAVVRSTYRLEPHANAGNIRLRYNAPVTVQDDGSLRISFENGTVNESAPQAWQEREGKRVPVRIAFARGDKGEVMFETGEYDQSEPLFIDPTLTWNTFLGGVGDDTGQGLAVDASGNLYVVGQSNGTWGSPVRAYSDQQDAFVAKLDANGTLIWSTFLGGDGGPDYGSALALDAIGNVYVTGASLATWGSPLSAHNGGYDAFLAKLDSNGTLIWNTFLGGATPDWGNAVAVDAIGNVYVVGYSSGTWGSPIAAFAGFYDAFAAKLDSNGTLIWNTFLGSAGNDQGYAVAVDVSGNVYVAGFSEATWGSPVRAFSGVADAFAAKLDASGTLVWNTFLGGGDYDFAVALAVDGGGNVYTAGFSYATWGSPVRAFSGGEDAFAAKLDSNGTLIWNTFLGSGSTDAGLALALDGVGNVYVAGYSDASWGSPVRAHSGDYYDAFAAQLGSSGTLTWNTFLGGGGIDQGTGVAVDGSGNVYVAGYSGANWGDSTVRAYSGGNDVFVAQIALVAPTPTPTPPPTPTATPTPTPTPTPSLQGNFVIGDGNAVVGNRVTFWSAQWANLNSVSGGPAPTSFKGFASSTSPNPPICGGAWTSHPGNSSGPPSSVPSLITVIVTSSITRSGPTISGNIPEMVIVQTDSGYGPNPGQTGTGTVVAVICQ